MTDRPLPSTRAHLDALTATGAPGWLVLTIPAPELETDRGVPWVSWSFPATDVDDAAQAVAELDQQGRNVYLRASLLDGPLDPDRRGWSWQRGGADRTGAAVALVVDLDVAGPGHKPGDKLPLPPERATALRIVADLPPPSLTIDTGGGLHLWWLLEEPELDHPVEVLDTWADRIVHAGHRQGWHVDRPDPARVLRVCGTHRRKPGLDPNPVTLLDVAGWPPHGLAERPWCPRGRYRAAELIGALPEPPAPPATPGPRPAGGSAPTSSGEIGPASAVAQLAWGEILEPLGWSYMGEGRIDGQPVELWNRPGATSTPSLKASPEGWAVAWSDACGLPTGRGQRLSKWRVYCALHHPGTPEADVSRLIRRRALEVAR